MTKKQYIDERYTAHLHYWTRLGLGVGSLIILMLITLDYAAVPTQFHAFMFYRLVAAGILFLLYLLNRTTIQRSLQSGSVVAAGAVVATMVAAMVHDFQGHESPYFAGFILVAIFVAGIIPMSFKASVFAGLLVYSLYLMPILAYDTIRNKPYFMSANILILASIASLLMLQYFRARQTLKEFGLEYEQREAEEVLLAREQQLADSQRIAHIGSWERNLSNDQMVWSDEMFRILGFNPETDEATFKGFLEIVHPEDREGLKKNLRETMELRKPFAIDCRLALRDGGARTIHAQGELVLDAVGKPILLRGIAQDITERKEAEEKVKKTKEEWERTFDAIDDPIMIIDRRHRIIKANKSMAGKLGVTPDKAEGMTCYKSVHGLSEAPPFCPHAKLLADGLSHTEEVHEPRLDGVFIVSVSPLYTPDNALYGSVHVARDITRQKKDEETIRQFSINLERLLSISHETTSTTDLKSLYRTFVSTSQDLLSLDFSTLLLLSEDKTALTVQDCLGFPETMIGHFSLVEGQGLSTCVLKSKKSETVADFATEVRFEVPPIVREKGIRSAVAVPMMMKDDVIGVLIGHTLAPRFFSRTDLIIYQHIANQAAVAIRNAISLDMLKKSEKYVRDITASLGEGVYVLNAQGETTFMNPEAEMLLGWSEKELIHKNIHEIVHNRKPGGATLLFEDCEMRKVIETGNRFHSTNEVFIRKDGTAFPVSIHSTPLIENGNIVASVTAFRDISERKRIEQEREQLISDLQKALSEIKTLHGILPICSFCKKIRDDKGAWNNLEAYISEHTDAMFSHGLCMECARKMYPEYYKE